MGELSMGAPNLIGNGVAVGATAGLVGVRDAAGRGVLTTAALVGAVVTTDATVGVMTATVGITAVGGGGTGVAVTGAGVAVIMTV